jgi:C_GCAxxG_C_C family probable redox protein
MDSTAYSKKAKQLFLDGYNCAQAVFLAFSDLYDIDEKTAAMLSSSFGGGLGRMREVCGAVSGMAMTIGVLYGSSDPKAQSEKAEHYKRIQYVANEFKKQNGSIICKELLGLEKPTGDPTPEKRTTEYYKKRPCAELVEMAAAITADYINSQGTVKAAKTE